MSNSRPELGGIVLTGGAAVRFQGADKASIEIGGATLLEHVLGALAEVAVLGVTQLDRRTAAVLSKQSPKSSAYGAHVAALNSAGLIGYPGDGQLALTDAGRDLTGPPGPPPTQGELHRRWLGYLGDYEADLLRVLIDHHPWPLQRPQLAELAGRSANSSAFGAAVAAPWRSARCCWSMPPGGPPFIRGRRPWACGPRRRARTSPVAATCWQAARCPAR